MLSNSHTIDLRSDTLTLPTAQMKEFMWQAPLGDDVFGEDPTVIQLQEKVARWLKKEAALFVPSGTMANQIAIGVHSSPGDEMLCHPLYHVHTWEGGGPARHWGVSLKPVWGERGDGVLTCEDLKEQVAVDDPHFARTRLIVLENTINRFGGKIYPLEEIKKISSWAKEQQLLMHLDGARLYHAIVATEVPAHVWAQYFDTVSLCFSKGLGAPVGSILVGSREHIKKALRLRKVLGGGMRQAGFLAAAGIYALDHHIQRLSEDHAKAQLLAQSISQCRYFSLEFPQVETNLVWFKISPQWGDAQRLMSLLKTYGILMGAKDRTTVRAAMHLNVSLEDIEFVAKTMRGLDIASLN